MGWFDEQIRNRSLSDQEMFEESDLSDGDHSVVVGNRKGCAGG